MKSRAISKNLTATVSALALAVSQANGVLAKGGELIFESEVTAVEVSEENHGSISVKIHDAEIPVIINNDTEIEEGGEDIALDNVMVGDFVEIAGFFAEEGLVADEVEILDMQGEQFRLQGAVSDVDSSGDEQSITVLEITVAIDGNSEISRRGAMDDEIIALSELGVGELVNVSGSVDNGQFTAYRVHVGEREYGLIELEGDITGASDSSFTLQIRGGSTVEIFTDNNTEIDGGIEEGSFVEVEGQLQEDLSLVAFYVGADIDGDGDADDEYFSVEDDDDEEFEDGDSEEEGVEDDESDEACEAPGEEDEDSDSDEDTDSDSGEDSDESADADEDSESDEEESDCGDFDDDDTEGGDDGEESGDEDSDDESGDEDSNEESDEESDEDSDEESGDGEGTFAEFPLSSDDESISGIAEWEYETEGDESSQFFLIELTGLTADTNYSLAVVFGADEVDAGTVTSDAEGELVVEFGSEAEDDVMDISSLLPDSKDVRDITGVKLTDGPTTVLDNSF
ncbi:MAG: DUF5666 domain-containing protein [Pseudomonadales bacterium]|nr:DUF5666 domain-containing protein [Pseudomonadales bacterium]